MQKGKTEAELERMFTEERFTEYSEKQFASVDNGIKLSMVLKDIARLEKVVLDPEDIETGYRQIKERVKEQEEREKGLHRFGSAAVSDKSIRYVDVWCVVVGF